VDQGLGQLVGRGFQKYYSLIGTELAHSEEGQSQNGNLVLFEEQETHAAQPTALENHAHFEPPHGFLEENHDRRQSEEYCHRD